MASFPVRNLQELREVITRMDEISPLISKLIEFEARSGLRYVDLSKLQFSDLMINGTIRRSFDVVQSKPLNSRLKYIERAKAAGKSHMTIAQAKQKSKITIHVNDELEELIRKLYIINGAHKLVFQSTHHHAKEGKAISIQYINRVFKRIAVDMALPYELSTHSMRKSFAMMLLDKNASMKVIMESLGQSSLSATEHYINTFHDEKKEFTTDISF
jgi:integrase